MTDAGEKLEARIERWDFSSSSKGAALAAIRDELERAAGIADAMAGEWESMADDLARADQHDDSDIFQNQAKGAREIAAAIRKLKE